jgi:hypothetical protein
MEIRCAAEYRADHRCDRSHRGNGKGGHANLISQIQGHRIPLRYPARAPHDELCRLPSVNKFERSVGLAEQAQGA